MNEPVKKKIAGGLAIKKIKGILPHQCYFKRTKSLSNVKMSALQRLQNRAFDIIEAYKIKNSLIRPTFSID